MTLQDYSKTERTYWRFSQSVKGRSQETPFAEYKPGSITVAEYGQKLSFASDKTIAVCFMFGDLLTELNFDQNDLNFQKIMHCEVHETGNTLGELQCEKLLTKANYSLKDLSTIRLLFSMVNDDKQLATIFAYTNSDGERFADFLRNFGFEESASLIDYLKMEFERNNCYLSPQEAMALIDDYLIQVT